LLSSICTFAKLAIMKYAKEFHVMYLIQVKDQAGF